MHKCIWIRCAIKRPPIPSRTNPNSAERVASNPEGYTCLFSPAHKNNVMGRATVACTVNEDATLVALERIWMCPHGAGVNACVRRWLWTWEKVGDAMLPIYPTPLHPSLTTRWVRAQTLPPSSLGPCLYSVWKTWVCRVLLRSNVGRLVAANMCQSDRRPLGRQGWGAVVREPHYRTISISLVMTLYLNLKIAIPLYLYI